MKKTSGKALTFIDLFCGCGGFSLGMERAGFRCLAAIDSKEEAVSAYRANFSKETLVIRKDLAKFPPDKLAAKVRVNTVDVIVGGPPCQGFSNVRQVDAANHGRHRENGLIDPNERLPRFACGCRYSARPARCDG